MSRCTLCSGRTVSTEFGPRCLNSACEASKVTQQKGVVCRCGEQMQFAYSNAYGERKYACAVCGHTMVY